MKTRYKFFRLQGKTIKSDSGNLKWKKGEWQKVDEELAEILPKFLEQMERTK